MTEAVLNLIRDVAEGRRVRLFFQGDLSSSVTVQGFLSTERPGALESIGPVRSQWIRKLQKSRAVTVMEILDSRQSTPKATRERKRA